MTKLILIFAALVAVVPTANAESTRDRCFDMVRRSVPGITVAHCESYSASSRRSSYVPPATAQIDGTWNGYEGSPRDVAWMESCRPTLTTDRYGMTRYVYAKRGCETGEPQ